MSRKPKNFVPLKASRAVRQKRGRDARMRGRLYGDFTPEDGAVCDQPQAPVRWTDEATEAVWKGYVSVRQFPGYRDMHRAGMGRAKDGRGPRLAPCGGDGIRSSVEAAFIGGDITRRQQCSTPPYS